MPTILSYYAQHCMHVPGKWIYYAQRDGGQKAFCPPSADRLAPTPAHAHPLCSPPEQSRATPLPSAASPTPGATIVSAPPPNGHRRRSATQNPAKSFGHLYIIDLYKILKWIYLHIALLLVAR